MMTKKHKLFNLFLLLVIGIITMSFTPTVYFIGDSTMADYDPSIYPNQRGWGQMFRNFMVGDISFVNGGRNGRSSRSFYTGSDSLWAAVRTKLKIGDYVFIQFAHNDEKLNGISDTAVTGGIATAPWGDFQDYLRRYVNETRNLGATPVLVTPIVRCYFSGNFITEKGKHNLGTDDSTLNYVRAIKAVARELSVPLIDHTASTCKLAESYGATNAYSTIYVTTDQTHLNPVGATLYAQLAVQEMLSKNILTNYLNASPNLIITPSAIDFGNCYVSAYASSKLSVSGLSLTPAAGNVIVSAPVGFSVGHTSAGTFSDTIQLPYTGGNLTATDIYVRFQPIAEMTYSDSITISYGTGTYKKVSVKGQALLMADGVAASVNYPLLSDATPIVTGPVISVDESWTGMYIKNYATIASWPTGIIATNKTQRNSLTGDTWPAGEIDINTGRYIQFGVKVNAGTILTIDSIGIYVGAAGGSGLQYRVMYSKNVGFSNPVALENKTSNTSNTMVVLSYKPMIQVADSEEFYLRFYPWYNGTASSKYLCLSNLTISGKVSTPPNAISEISQNRSPVIYPNPSNGIFYLKNKSTGEEILIFTQSGVFVRKIKCANQNQLIDISDCANGVYLCCTASGKKAEVVRIVKK
jgi:lysophospholipase L1-like esterase